MNTTYILHGGQTSKESKYNDDFFKEFTISTESQTVRILLCYWAREEIQWQALSDRDKTKIQNQSSKNIETDIVTNPQELFKKIKDYDVLYVAGGDAPLIEPYYDHLGDLREHLSGKVYIGSSMGAFLVSENYVLSYDSQDSKTVHKGTGILPINTLCHWDVENNKDQKIKLLSDHAPQLPIITLDECHFAKFVI